MPFCLNAHLRQLLAWEGAAMALAASAFAYYFGYGCRSQYSCGIDKAHLFKRICKGAAVISRLTALLPWEDGAMARVARVFACYFEHGYRSQYSCGIDKVHLFERVRKDTATHVIATPEHGV